MVHNRKCIYIIKGNAVGAGDWILEIRLNLLRTPLIDEEVIMTIEIQINSRPLTGIDATCPRGRKELTFNDYRNFVTPVKQELGLGLMAKH
jgi:hypothetical protein